MAATWPISTKAIAPGDRFFYCPVGAYENRVAIDRLKALDLAVLLAWGAEDAITAPAEPFLRSLFRKVVPPPWISGAGHFIQEDAGEEVAAHIVEWMNQTPQRS